MPRPPTIYWTLNSESFALRLDFGVIWTFLNSANLELSSDFVSVGGSGVSGSCGIPKRGTYIGLEELIIHLPEVWLEVVLSVGDESGCVGGE